MQEIKNLQEQLAKQRSEVLTTDMLSRSITSGILTAVSDPAMWHSAMIAMQTRAKVEAGGWLLGSLKAVVSRLAWILVIGMAAYWFGGWAALAALFKSGGPR